MSRASFVQGLLNGTQQTNLLCAMSANVATVTVNGQNGVKANGKIKSKNQLRRLKAKAKKVAEANDEQVSLDYVCHTYSEERLTFYVSDTSPPNLRTRSERRGLI